MSSDALKKMMEAAEKRMQEHLQIEKVDALHVCHPLKTCASLRGFVSGINDPDNLLTLNANVDSCVWRSFKRKMMSLWYFTLSIIDFWPDMDSAEWFPSAWILITVWEVHNIIMQWFLKCHVLKPILCKWWNEFCSRRRSLLNINSPIMGLQHLENKPWVLRNDLSTKRQRIWKVNVTGVQ